jgi:hypothetical protein
MPKSIYTAKGRACPKQNRPLLPDNHQWLGWQGTVTHPDAPSGSGGPGGFSHPLNADEAAPLLHPQTPRPQRFSPDQVKLSTQKKPNAPPSTQTQSWSMLKIKTDHVDVDISAEVVADGKTNEDLDAHTDAAMPTHPGLPTYTSENGKITSFGKVFEWKGKITVQTLYNKGKPEKFSCYGRGTTEEDLENGDITLGFHEACHRADFVDYLKNHALPKPPDMKIDMTATAYDTASTKFNKEFGDYAKALSELWKVTDEVGHKLSTVKSTGECYPHQLAEEEA